jgi:RNA polymerase II C-terminal domain phosphatase-like 3/4
MQVGFRDCGTAAVACLLEPHCLTAVWTGDCRAVAGLVVGTTQGPAVLVHQLTRDHKPENPLEHARIVATGRGRVVQLREGQSHRLCGYEATSQSIALSRALGDAWATQLGLTHEPDAVSITLPNPARISGDWDSSSSGGSGSAARPARHVLVVASDGLWDMCSNEEAVGIALSCSSPDEAAQALMQTACRRWAAAYEGEFLDDISLAVAFLPA